MTAADKEKYLKLAREWLVEWYRDDEVGLPSPKAIESLADFAAAVAKEARVGIVTPEMVSKADKRTGSSHMNDHEGWAEIMARELNAALEQKP